MKNNQTHNQKTTLQKVDAIARLREALPTYRVPYTTDARDSIKLTDVTRKLEVRFLPSGTVEVLVDLDGTENKAGATRTFSTMQFANFTKVDISHVQFKGETVAYIQCWGADALHFMVRTW